MTQIKTGQRRRGIFRPLTLAASLALALSACGTPSAAPPGQPGSAAASGGSSAKVTIGIGGQTLLTYLPTTLAQELGYYKDEGLNVELQDLQGGSKALTAMIGGSTNVTSGYYEHTIQMQAKNQPIKAFVDMGRSSGLVLLVAPKNEGKIKTIADLKGKNVGVTAPDPPRTCSSSISSQRTVCRRRTRRFRPSAPARRLSRPWSRGRSTPPSCSSLMCQC